MLILLPPSETKRPGGAAASLAIETLALPQLAPQRHRVTDALVALSSDDAEAARVLKLGPKQLDQVAVNARIRSAPTMPAIDRYTGVLFDALDAGSLDTSARAWLGEHVMIHSAPWGPVGALDEIPEYRLGATTRLPGLETPKRLWANAVSAAITGAGHPYVLDLRSEAYAALGPAAGGDFVRVVAVGSDGVSRALNHFNKRAKGLFVRRLASAAPDLRSRADLLAWASASGVHVREHEGSVQLVVESE